MTTIFCRVCGTTTNLAETPLVAECPKCGSNYVEVSEVTQEVWVKREKVREDAIRRILTLFASPLLRMSRAEREPVLALAREYEITAAELLEYLVGRTHT